MKSVITNTTGHNEGAMLLWSLHLGGICWIYLKTSTVSEYCYVHISLSTNHLRNLEPWVRKAAWKQ